MSWYEWLTGGEDGHPSGGCAAAPSSWCRLGEGGPTVRQGDPFAQQCCERVLVRVYDLGTSILTHPHNSITKSYGAFHTGVEVYGREWAFGMSEDFRSGVTWCAPGKNRDHTFRETLAMGHTSCSSVEFMQIIDDMKQEWRGSTYNLLTRNCHHFSDELCARLGVARLPPWVNDLAGVGDATASLLDKAYNSVSITDAFHAVKSGMYLTIAGVPRCLMGRERLELEEYAPECHREEDTGHENAPAEHLDVDDLHNMDHFQMHLHSRSLKEMPPCRGDLVYPAEGEAVLVYHTMCSNPLRSREGTEEILTP